MFCIRMCSRFVSLNRRKLLSLSIVIALSVTVSLFILSYRQVSSQFDDDVGLGVLMGARGDSYDAGIRRYESDRSDVAATIGSREAIRAGNLVPSPKETTSLPTLRNHSLVPFLNYQKINPFIVQPNMLEKLKKGEGVVRDDVLDLKIMGIFHTQVKLMGNVLAQASPYFNVSTTYRRLPVDVTADRKRYVTCYSFLAKSGETFRVMVVYFRNNFVYIPSCLRSDKHHLFTEAILGETPLVFDRFNLMKMQIDEMTFVRPSDPHDLLTQYQSSHYHECRRDMAPNFTDSNEPASNRKTMLSALVYFKKNLKILGKLPFLAAGSLLGWYRQCSFIRGSGDIDLALYSRDLTNPLHQYIRTHPNITGYHYNLPKDGYQYYLYVYGERIDLFFLYDTARQDTVYSGQWAPERERIRLYFPRSEVCSAVLLGHRFNIPCRIETMLMTEYGKLWKVRGDYGGEIEWPLNYEILKPWDDKTWKKAFMNIRDEKDVVE